MDLVTIQNEVNRDRQSAASHIRVLEAKDIPGLLYRIYISVDETYPRQSTASLTRLTDGVKLTTGTTASIHQWISIGLAKEEDLSPEIFEDFIVNVFEPVIQADIRGH